jgi:acetolactate synthase-1/2/3 large subunit
MTVAEYIANKLYNIGVRYVFGIPGGPSIPYIESFKAAGIEFILTSNESSAAIMADVTARMTGIPGICHATYGPGATNISTGIGGAFLDRSPVIVFTSEMEDKMISRTTQMNIDHQRLFSPITKASFRLNTIDIKEVLDKAIKICLMNYPGPVHIGLPSDISDNEIDDSDYSGLEIEIIRYESDVKKITSLLEKSQRPLMAVGLTAARLGIHKELISFLKEFNMPVVVTPMAKGLIPEDHPCYAGVLFHALSDYLEDIYENIDLIIGIGYDPVEYNYESWIPDVPVIHFNVIETDMPSSGSITQYIGPHPEWFNILKSLSRGSLLFDKTLIEGIRNEMASVFNGFTNHFGPVSVLKILQEELPADAILTVDVGSHLHLFGQLWRTGSIGKTVITNGWSGMGFGIPAALAIQLLRREATVVCINGDGGFLMMAGEMITARRYNLPIIVVVLSDGELNLIKLKQSWKDLPPYGTQLYQGDLFVSDIFFGVRVLNADSPETMKHAINEALALNQPVIINAVIDPDDYKWLVVRK